MAKTPATESGIHLSWAQQSPIDLGKSFYTPDLPALSFQYDSEVAGHLHEHNFDLAVGSNASLTIHEPIPIVLPLVRIHFHAPSEHSVNLQEAPFEAHLVHQGLGIPGAFASTFVVVGIFFTNPRGKHAKSQSMQQAIRSFGFQPGEDDLQKLTPSVLLPQDRSNYFRYEGSLTTPPYSENVSWIVMKAANPLDTPVERTVEEKTEETARALQPLARRFVLRNFSETDKEGWFVGNG